MDYLPEHKYLKFNTNTLEEVRREVNLHRAGEMKEAVRIVQEWIQQQPHFKKKDFSLHYLEMTIVMSKGSLERAKKVFDSTCTIRTLMPHMFKPLQAKEGLQNTWQKTYILSLPKLTPDNSRIVLLKCSGKYNKKKNLDDLHNYVFMMYEYTRLHDYCAKIVVIFDLTETDLKDMLLNINLLQSKNCVLILLESYKIRIQRIHLITKCKLIERFIAFFRPILSKKIMDRLEVNKSYEELYQYYPKDILPQEYNGYEKPMSELNDECIEIYSSHENLKHMNSMMEVLDESQRSQAEFNELYAGTVGTFRSLAVD